MTFEIELSDEAKLDLEEARGYYGQVSTQLLNKFDVYLIETVERLKTNPENFQQRYRNIKIVFTKTFPYGIHYLVESQTVYIQRILHQKQFYG